MTNSIRKGKAAEREIVNLFKSYGIDAQRISMMETQGIDKGDVRIGRFSGQVKKGSHVPKSIYKFMENNEDLLFMRRDRKEWIVCIKLEKFIENFYEQLKDA